MWLRNASNNGFLGSVDLEQPGALANDECGWSVATRDLNRDGRDDVAVAVAYIDAPVAVPALRRVPPQRRETTASTSGRSCSRPTGQGGDLCGYSLAFADVDANGRPDVILGCRGDDDGASNGGTAVVRLASDSGAPVRPGHGPRRSDPCANEWCGFSMAANDVDQVAGADVLTGCAYDDAPLVDTAR